MNTVDLTNVVQPTCEIAFAIIGIVLTRYVPRLISALETKLDLHLTDQQNAELAAAVTTAAGTVETLIDQKAMGVEHVVVNNPTVRIKAQAILDTLPDAADAMGLTVNSVANMIVGAVDTGTRTAQPTAPPVSLPTAAPALPIKISTTV